MTTVKVTSWFYALLLMIGISTFHYSFAQDEGDAAATDSADGEEATADDGEKTPIAKDIPRLKRKPVTAAGIVRTRHTSNKTEAMADKVTEVLAMGISRIIDIDYDGPLSPKNIFVSNVQVATVVPILRPDGKQLVINPIGKGETAIQIRNDKTGDVPIIIYAVVTEQNLYRVYTDLKESLREVEGIQIKIDGNRVVISGEVLTPNDYGLIANVITDPALGGTISNRVTMSPVSLNALAKKIEADIQVFAPTITSSVLNGKIILEGTVESEGLKTRALRRAEWYLPPAKLLDPIEKDAANVAKTDKPMQIIQSDIVVQVPPPKRESKLIRISTHFVELSKDFLKTFGFKWQPGFTADPSISLGTTDAGSSASSAAGGFTFSGTLSSLFPALNSVQSAGYGRILKSATAVVKSQEKLKVKDTQNSPSQSIGANGAVAAGNPTTVGFDMDVTPTILQGSDVDMSISLDQSTVVSRVGNQPVTANHHIDTRVYLKSGEVAAIAGMNSQDVTTAFNRDDPRAGNFASPQGGGAQTNPIWTLMRSKNFNKKRGQFVIFISPQIVESASEGTEDLKKNFRMKSNN